MVFISCTATRVATSSFKTQSLPLRKCNTGFVYPMDCLLSLNHLLMWAQKDKQIIVRSHTDTRMHAQTQTHAHCAHKAVQI